MDQHAIPKWVVNLENKYQNQYRSLAKRFTAFLLFILQRETEIRI